MAIFLGLNERSPGKPFSANNWFNGINIVHTRCSLLPLKDTCFSQGDLQNHRFLIFIQLQPQNTELVRVLVFGFWVLVWTTYSLSNLVCFNFLVVWLSIWDQPCISMFQSSCDLISLQLRDANLKPMIKLWIYIFFTMWYHKVQVWIF